MEKKYSTHFIDANEIVEAYFEYNNYNTDMITDGLIEDFIEILRKDSTNTIKLTLDHVIKNIFTVEEIVKLKIN